MYKPFWALLFLLSCTYSAAFADDPTSESKGWGGVAPAPSENECRSFIEAALKEQRQVETGGGGDGVEEASTIAPEDQINAVDQVNEETTADASTENIESTEPSDAVEETNERVEISETEPEEPETSIEHEQAATDSADEIPVESVESEGAPVESTEELVTESAEAEATPEVVSEAEPEETVTESAEAEGVPVESSEAEETAEAVEAEGAQTESAEAEPEEVPTEAGEAVAESSDAEATPTESAEAEVPELIVETPSGTVENDVTEEQLKKELAESVEGEIEQPTEEAISTEEIVKDGGESAVEDVLPESRETETEPEEPMSDEEHMLSDQPVETDASGEAPAEQETEISQEVGSEQVEEQSSVETEETATEQEVQEVEPEEIVEDVVQETVEHVNTPVNEETIASEAEPTEEQITEPINEVVEPSEEERTTQDIEDTENVHSPSEDTGEASETPESPETIHEEPPVETEEATPTTPEESPATNAVVQEIPAESGASVEQESAPQPQTEQEPQDKAVAVDEGVEEEIPEQEDLTLNIEIPENLRSRNHISEVLRLDTGSIDTEAKLLKAEESTLKELKRVYEAAIKPLEILYKYRDLSNRHFGDPEIFSKPLILFMGPWSGGKSTIINYLLDNEYKQTALRTGAEPSPAYFNIVMWGEREEVMDGTQLAADWTFSGLQKFGQGLLDRLRGLKLNNPLLEKVNIVEIPGILEIRKQVERLFPLNDACQWFIDRADIIFLVYDPSKLDVGPETEAILDQLKGREYQTKIILNKADQVKPEELMRVQGTLIWNISPLMSSTEPPVMYSTSLWSHPYQLGSPSRLLFAQEKAFLKDLREAMEKRVENKISSARRFAVRVRNHAKMVDCYLTTYYNHKTFFGNKEKVSEDIIEHPQNYHIYEGLSTLTNISRYDLPDPDVYKDFFRLNPVYDFQQLASTCTYFKGCPINRLDVAIAYDLPELVGRYKKVAEDVKSQGKK